MSDSKESSIAPTKVQTNKQPFYFQYFKQETLENMFENQTRMLFLWPVKYDGNKFCDCSAESVCMGKIAFDGLYSASSDCFPICCERAMQEVLQTSYDELVIQVDQEEIFPFSKLIFGQYWNKITIKTITDIDSLLQSNISCSTLQLSCTMFYKKYLEYFYQLLFTGQIQQIKLITRDMDIGKMLSMLDIKLADPYNYDSNIIFRKDSIEPYNHTTGKFDSLAFDPVNFFRFDV